MRKNDKKMLMSELNLIGIRLNEIADKIEHDPDFGHYAYDLRAHADAEPDPETNAGLLQIAREIEKAI